MLHFQYLSEKYKSKLQQKGHHQKSPKKRFWRQHGEKGSFLHYWGKCKLVEENRMEDGYKARKKATICSSSTAAGHRSSRNLSLKRNLAVQSSLHHCLQSTGATQCPLTDEWIREVRYLYAMGYYSAKNNKIMP